MTAHCEWCPFPGCDSCAYKGWRRSEPAVIQTPDTRGPWGHGPSRHRGNRRHRDPCLACPMTVKPRPTVEQSVQDAHDHWQVWHSTKEERA